MLSIIYMHILICIQISNNISMHTNTYIEMHLIFGAALGHEQTPLSKFPSTRKLEVSDGASCSCQARRYGNSGGMAPETLSHKPSTVAQPSE